MLIRIQQRSAWITLATWKSRTTLNSIPTYPTVGVVVDRTGGPTYGLFIKTCTTKKKHMADKCHTYDAVLQRLRVQ